MTGRKFIIYALPRSRTAWMARWLGGGGWTCHHDLLVMDEFMAKWLGKRQVGTVETSTEGWEILTHLEPEAKVVVVMRPLEEVAGSLARLGLPTETLGYLHAQLLRLTAHPGVLVYDWKWLGVEAHAKTLWEFCRGEGFDRIRWRALDGVRVEVDIDAELGRLRGYAKAHKSLPSGRLLGEML